MKDNSIQTTASHFKANLGKFMKAIRDGKEVVVTNRDEPVARLVPWRCGEGEKSEPKVSRYRDPAAPPLGQVDINPIKYRGTPTSMILTEDRERR